MEPYIYYGRLPLIEEGPLANYTNKKAPTEVAVSIRFAKTSWRADVLRMGFQIDEPFPTLGEYRQIEEVRVSSISPQSPEGPTILVNINGTGIVGLPIVLQSSGAGRADYTLEYVMSLPANIRPPLYFILSDVIFINPTREDFTTKDKAGRTYSGNGRKRTRNIVAQSAFFGMTGVSGIGYSGGNNAIVTGTADTSDRQYDGMSGRVRQEIIDWVEVTNIVYADGGPPTP